VFISHGLIIHKSRAAPIQPRLSHELGTLSLVHAERRRRLDSQSELEVPSPFRWLADPVQALKHGLRLPSNRDLLVLRYKLCKWPLPLPLDDPSLLVWLYSSLLHTRLRTLSPD
jgi:hypothetical protein